MMIVVVCLFRGGFTATQACQDYKTRLKQNLRDELVQPEPMLALQYDVVPSWDHKATAFARPGPA